MSKMKQHMIHTRQRQCGSVAVIVGLTITLLVGMLGLVVDLGHLYVAKAELQNAADAAALSGAKELNGTVAGVTNARDRAIEAAGLNKYNLNSTAVTITAANLSVGNCPDDACMVPISTVTTLTLAADKTFLKVDTGSRSLSTWFIQVLPGALTSTSTFGMAVAGRLLVNVAPLGVCAISTTQNVTNPTTNELSEFGFRRGIAYDIPELNPLGASGIPMWLNPVDAPPATCDPSHASAAFTRPFVCQGNAATIKTLPQSVYVSTGTSATLATALNSRFDVFTGGTCDPVTAPPDTNIKQFKASPTGPNPASCPTSAAAAAGCGFPRDWMDTLNATTPTQQTISLAAGPSGRFIPVATPTYLQYGALWSFSRAVHGAGTAFNASNTDWSSLYNSGVSLPTLINTTAGGYPDPADTTMSPYKKGALVGSSNKYFTAPSVSHPGKSERRVLTLAILDCSSLVGAGLSCSTITAIGIGKFFMQVPADFSGSPKKIEAEFAGLITQLPPADIRLYR
jgi:Flp pilus assembly protein TadG